jgi:serpin B
MKKILAIIIVPILLLSLVGCTNSTSSTTPAAKPVTTPVTTSPATRAAAFKVLKADAPRITAPDVSDTQLSALVNGNSAFAFALYQQLKKNSAGNLFYSPYSISTALAMTYAGAIGDTGKQMGSALHFTLPQTQLHAAFNQLALDLAFRGQNEKGVNGKNFTLNIANALWGQQELTIQPAFLNILAQDYGAGLNLLDFKNSPEPSRVTINNWVSDQTNSRIKDLLPQGSINPGTRLVLTNAIYFDAAWQSPFTKDSTHNGTFNLLDGATVSVPIMSHEAGYSYVKGDSYQAVEMPYRGNEIAMDIIVPDAGKFTSFESAMTADKVTGILGSLKSSFLVLSLPKFQFDSSFSLKDTLSALGMPVAFTDKADFSGITGKPDLFLSDVVHKAFVAVDEAGTEAAAATGVIMAGAAMPQNSLTIDRPFIFLIRDIPTGAILFVGRVLNPAS